MREVTDESFERDVVRSQLPIVVDFWAPWCRPCEAVVPVFEQLAAAHSGRVLFARVNIEEHPAAAARYGVLSLPTAILFDAGEPRETVVGARSSSYYERRWAAWLGAAGPRPK